MLVIAFEVLHVKTRRSSKRYGLSPHVDLGEKNFTKKENSHLSSMVCSALGQDIVAIGAQELVMCDHFFVF
jgi:hypothetical protein